MKTIQEMALEAGWGNLVSMPHIKALKAFAALVREEAIAETNAKANASWTLMCEKMVSIEREACAKMADDYFGFNAIADAIRARNNT